jgi:hypothetical protein
MAAHMIGVQGINLLGVFASAISLRAAAAGATGQIAIARVATLPMADMLYLWQGASLEVDDGITVIKPNSIAVGNPGRWVQRAVSDIDPGMGSTQ